MTLQAVKGMKDILPEEIAKWQRLEAAIVDCVVRYGFKEVRTPIVEPTELFVRSIGETTDIVEKEMYTFTDRGDKSLTLRPEGTASSVRAYIQHKVYALEPVSKWYYLGPMYRRERPAKGRYRQFFQAGVEVFGDPGPYVDAEVIDMVVRLISSLGIVDVEVVINSIGGAQTRQSYRTALLHYLEPLRDRLSQDSQRRMETNPLRVLDSKAPEDAEIAAGAPSIHDHLDEADRVHFDQLQETLTALGTPYRVDNSLVRGLDYYTRTLFEVLGRGEGLGAQNALLGGGRYDKMVESLGGPDVPAIGFAMGLERLLMAMPEQDLSAHADVFLIAAQPTVRRHVVMLGSELRAAGLRVESDLRGGSLKSQLRRADKMGVRVALILGESEIADDVVQLKDLREQDQRSVPRRTIVPELKRLFG